MSDLLELKNIEIKEYCVLDKETGIKNFVGQKGSPGYTGLYFKDSNNFFALYPTKHGPKIYYQGNEFDIKKDLTITLEKRGKERTFKILEYDIDIEYFESPYIDIDIWSTEIDVDLFYLITQSYKSDDFYTRNTRRSN